jgi:hypothetical protein
LIAFEKIPQPEEAAQRPSRRPQGAAPPCLCDLRDLRGGFKPYDCAQSHLWVRVRYGLEAGIRPFIDIMFRDDDPARFVVQPDRLPDLRRLADPFLDRGRQRPPAAIGNRIV